MYQQFQVGKHMFVCGNVSNISAEKHFRAPYQQWYVRSSGTCRTGRALRVLLLLTVLRERPPTWAIFRTSDARVSASTTSLGPRPKSRSTQSYRFPRGGDSIPPIEICVIWNHLCRWSPWRPPGHAWIGTNNLAKNCVVERHRTWRGMGIPVKEPNYG